MNIYLGNLGFDALGDKDKMKELENRLIALGYSHEPVCDKNEDTERLTWHIYDIPRQINFSVLSEEVISVLKEYNSHFVGRVAVSATKTI